MCVNSFEKEVVFSDRAPKAIGPYSQAIKVGGFLFTSGQIPIVPETGDIMAGGIESQTRQVLENLKNILNEAGTNFENVIKTTVYITNMDDFPKINEIYGTYFKINPPARTTVQVAKLPKNVAIEIDAIAILS